MLIVQVVIGHKLLRTPQTSMHSSESQHSFACFCVVPSTACDPTTSTWLRSCQCGDSIRYDKHLAYRGVFLGAGHLCQDGSDDLNIHPGKYADCCACQSAKNTSKRHVRELLFYLMPQALVFPLFLSHKASFPSLSFKICPSRDDSLPCRITKATQGSAVFETVSEEQYMGRVVDRLVAPRGYNAAGTSGLLSCEIAGDKQQLPFGLGDLQVSNRIA